MSRNRKTDRNVCETISQAPKRSSFRFDIFKGVADSEGKIHKFKSVGKAYLTSGRKTYTLFLRTFTKEVFYLLPETKDLSRGDFGILTRVPSGSPTNKYIWNNVGEARLLSGNNKRLLHLQWDLLGVSDIYLSLDYEDPPTAHAQEGTMSHPTKL